jgi:hypothetical protein
MGGSKKGDDNVRRIWRTLFLTLLVAAVVGGLGYGIYQAGFEQGALGSGADLVESQGPVGPYIYGGIALVFKALFAFVFIGFIAKLFFFRRMVHHGGPRGDWQGRREEFKARMDEHLTEWHTRAHGEEGEEAPTTA